MTKQRTREEWKALLLLAPLDLLMSIASTRRHAVTPGGRTRLMKPCPKCTLLFSARDLRVHLPQCGAHLVPCKFCGQKSNARGTILHEAICPKNPNRKKGKAVQ